MLRERPVLWFFVLTYALSWGAFGWGFVVVGDVVRLCPDWPRGPAAEPAVGAA